MWHDPSLVIVIKKIVKIDNKGTLKVTKREKATKTVFYSPVALDEYCQALHLSFYQRKEFPASGQIHAEKHEQEGPIY